MTRLIRIVARLDSTPRGIIERIRFGVEDGPRHDEVLAWYSPTERRVKVTMAPGIGGRDRDLAGREIVNTIRRWCDRPVEWIDATDYPGSGWIPVTERARQRN